MATNATASADSGALDGPPTHLARAIQQAWGRPLEGDDFDRLGSIMGKSRTQAWRIATGRGSTRERAAIERLVDHFNEPGLAAAWELDAFPFASRKIAELQDRISEIEARGVAPAAGSELEAALAPLRVLRVAEAKQLVELVRKARALPEPLHVVLKLLDLELDILVRRRRLFEHAEPPK